MITMENKEKNNNKRNGVIAIICLLIIGYAIGVTVTNYTIWTNNINQVKQENCMTFPSLNSAVIGYELGIINQNYNHTINLFTNGTSIWCVHK